MSEPIQQLLIVADEFLRLTGRGEPGVSFAVFNDSKILKNLRNGSDLYVARFIMGMQWFSDNWPVRKAWPKGVKRPSPSIKQVA
jgi:hypothetical protein